MVYKYNQIIGLYCRATSTTQLWIEITNLILIHIDPEHNTEVNIKMRALIVRRNPVSCRVTVFE